MNYLNIIFNKTSILDLKDVYQKYIFSIQNDYERQIPTTISISIENEDNDEILLDQLTLTNGLIVTYYLSTIKNSIQMSIQGKVNEPGEITIKNYQIQEGLQLEEEINKLYSRCRNLSK